MSAFELPGVAASIWSPLFDETKGADAATFDTGAGGFSAAYAHLLLVAQLRTTEAAIISNTIVTLNNDTGATYDLQIIRGRDVTAASIDAQAAATNFQLVTPGATAAAGVFAAHLLLIPDYAGTVAEKTAVSMGGFADEAATGGEASVKTYHWRNTAAISRVILTAQGGSDFLTGSRLTVYGIGV